MFDVAGFAEDITLSPDPFFHHQERRYHAFHNNCSLLRPGVRTTGFSAQFFPLRDFLEVWHYVSNRLVAQLIVRCGVATSRSGRKCFTAHSNLVLSILSTHNLPKRKYEQVAVKFFHKADDDAAASARISLELVTNVRLYHGLRSTCIDEDDEGDIRHLARLRDVLVDVPIFDDSGAGLSPSVFRASAMVFDWADGGDAHSYLSERGGITPAEGGRLFRQILRGLRCLHRRGIVHRDIKVRTVNIPWSCARSHPVLVKAPNPAHLHINMICANTT